MYFLAVNRNKSDMDPQEFAAVIPAHVEWIERHIASGDLAQAGKWGDIGGMWVIKADSRSQAEELLAGDPLVMSGLCSLELARFWPVAGYSG